MENKSNTLLLTVIAVATLLVAVIGATFAYFTAQISGNTDSQTPVVVRSATLEINFADGSSSLTLADKVKPSESVIISKTFTLRGKNTTANTESEPNAARRMPYELYLMVPTNTFQLNNTVTGTSISYKLINTKQSGSTPAAGQIPSNTGYVPIPCTTLAPAGATLKDNSDTLQTSIIGNVTTYHDNGEVAINNQPGLKLGQGYFEAGANNVEHEYRVDIYFMEDNKNQDYDTNKSFSAYVTISVGNQATEISTNFAAANSGTEFTPAP